MIYPDLPKKSRQIRNSRLINEAYQCDYINSSISRRVDEVNRFAVQKAFRHISLFFKLLTKLIGHRYDLCYMALTCHGKSFLKDVPFALLCKIFVKRRVIHQHNKGMSQDVDRWPYRYLMPLVYRNTSVILLSWRLYPDIERVVPKERVWVCPNGTTVVNSFEKAKQNEVPHLLFLSNLIESKGVLVLLDALALLKEKNYSFHCDFVGAETREINASRWADEVRKRGLDKYVCYQGPRTGEEKARDFNNADIFVFPTYYECFPLVLLEAMSYGLPIVTTEEGGIPDIVEDGVNGIISERRNPQSLAIGIARLFDEPELRQKMGLAGRKRVEECFTENIFEKRLVEILQHLISARSFSLKTLKLVESRDALNRIPEGKVLINTLNAHSYNMSLEDEVFAQALQGGDYLIPDGMSIVKACKWLKAESRPKERIAGWDLFVFEMEKLNIRGGKCFFMGSSEAVLARIRERCAKDYPNIAVETYSPPYKPVFSAEDNAAIVDAINQADPDLLWIGLTAPKQEKWAYEHWPELNIHCHCGTVGAVFDFYAGTVKRAPVWMQNAGLEWFYRFVREPARMWRRYIIGNVKFIKNIVW